MEAELPTVAIIEDNSDSRLLLKVMLEGRYRVRTYGDGREGIEGLRVERPDILILDISLPIMDGYEVVRRLRHDMALKDVPVIALTAHALDHELERLMRAGFQDFVAKPILDEEVLFEAIDRLLPRSSRPIPIVPDRPRG
ncbi:MAG: response regulator [Acidobacteria bacterium]|nr:response regulator [Acidobacteriota bacterium]